MRRNKHLEGPALVAHEAAVLVLKMSTWDFGSFAVKDSILDGREERDVPKEILSRYQFPEDDPERINVHLFVIIFFPHHLWRKPHGVVDHLRFFSEEGVSEQRGLI